MWRAWCPAPEHQALPSADKGWTIAVNIECGLVECAVCRHSLTTNKCQHSCPLTHTRAAPVSTWLAPVTLVINGSRRLATDRETVDTQQIPLWYLNEGYTLADLLNTIVFLKYLYCNVGIGSWYRTDRLYLYYSVCNIMLLLVWCSVYLLYLARCPLSAVRTNNVLHTHSTTLPQITNILR